MQHLIRWALSKEDPLNRLRIKLNASGVFAKVVVHDGIDIPFMRKLIYHAVEPCVAYDVQVLFSAVSPHHAKEVQNGVS